MSGLRGPGALHRHAARPDFVPMRRLPQTDIVEAGTIFASSKLPLRLWFKAMYHLTQSKNGVSSLELGAGLASRRQPPGRSSTNSPKS